MKKSLVFIFLLSFSLSVVSQTKVPITYNDNLFYLCKSWGFAKYFHTEVSAGNVDWDQNLISVLESLTPEHGPWAMNELTLIMLQNAGEMGISNTQLPDVADSLQYNLDMSWIDHDVWSEATHAMLDTIRQRFRPHSQYYIQQTPGIGNPTFGNELEYSEQGNYPELSYRLLALFRYWNIIEYYFPYKDIMDQNWDSTLYEIIPYVVNAQTSTDYHLAMKRIAKRIDDSHAYIGSSTISSWDGIYFPPFLAEYIENKMVVTKVINGTLNVNVGDIIESMDGKDINSYIDSLAPYIHGSNDARIKYNIMISIIKGNSGAFEAIVNNGTENLDITKSRNGTNANQLFSDSGPSWEHLEIEGHPIGLVDMGKLEQEEVATIFNEFTDSEAIIFDIRNYPNGTLWSIVNYIYSASIDIANFTIPIVEYPGNFEWAYANIGNGTTEPYDGHIIILMNEKTVSQAEYTCMGLSQHPKAVKIGSQTAAADGNVSVMKLPGMITAYYTGIGTFYSDYAPTQRIGIIPDIEVHPTINGIKEGRDEVMEAAINYLIPVLINEEEAIDFQISPNPAQNYLQINLSEISGKTYSITIFDLSGKTITHFSSDNLKQSIPINNLKEGMYLLQLKTENQIRSRKFLVKREN